MSDQDGFDQIDDSLLGELGSIDPDPPEDTEPACSLNGVSVTFEDTDVLDDVSVDFPAGACTVIMGPSGSGKSTLLKAAAGLVVPDEGKVEILGRDPSRISDRELEALRARNGFVFQDGALWQNLTLEQNLMLPLQYHSHHIGAEEARTQVTRMAKELQGARRLALRPSQVSAGDRKTISFIRAIVHDPELIFMDEPTTSLDSERIDLLIRKLRDLRRRGRTLITVTHDARIASQLADYVLVIRDGRVLTFGTLHDVARSNDPEIERVLSDVLSETATYDGDILELMDPDTNPFLQ